MATDARRRYYVDTGVVELQINNAPVTDWMAGLLAGWFTSAAFRFARYFLLFLKGSDARLVAYFFEITLPFDTGREQIRDACRMSYSRECNVL